MAYPHVSLCLAQAFTTHSSKQMQTNKKKTLNKQSNISPEETPCNFWEANLFAA